MRADRVRVGTVIDVHDGETGLVDRVEHRNDEQFGTAVLLHGCIDADRERFFTRVCDPDTDIETALPATVFSPDADAALPPVGSGRGEL